MTKEEFEDVKHVITKIFKDVSVTHDEDGSISIGPGMSLQSESKTRKIKTLKGEREIIDTCYTASVELYNDVVVLPESFSFAQILENIVIYIARDKLTWAML